MVPLTRR